MISLALFEMLPETPTTADATAFLESAFRAVGIGFHPDTSFHDYVDPATGARLFRDDDTDFLDRDLAQAVALQDCEPEDAADLCLRLARDWYARNRGDDEYPQPVVVGP